MISRALSFLILVYLFGYALFVVLLPRPADDRRTDAIVVLTGGAGRIERGLDLIERGRADRMLISGVARTVRPVELARESVDTRSNAVETARWLERRKLKTVRLVTTDWHMPRAEFELSRQVGSEIDMFGDAVESNPSFRQLFTEYNKYLLRRAAVFLGI